MQTRMEPHTLILQSKFSGGYADRKSSTYSHYKHISFCFFLFPFLSPNNHKTNYSENILKKKKKLDCETLMVNSVFPHAVKFFSC